MSTTPVTALLPNVLVGVAGVPEPVAAHAIWQACESFCDKSLSVVQDQTVQLLSGEGLLQPDPHVRLARVLQVVVGGSLVPPFKGVSVLPVQQDGGRGYVATHDGAIRVFGVSGSTAEVRYAVAPARGVTDVPSVLLSRYSEAITAGAKGVLLGMSGTVWYDPAAAAQYAAQFQAAVAQARVDGATGVSLGSARVAPVAFV